MEDKTRKVFLVVRINRVELIIEFMCEVKIAMR